MTTQCECPLAGYCERHNRIKNERLHALCQGRQDYFDAWERTPKKQRKFALGPIYNHWAPLHHYAVKHWHDWNEKAARAWYRRWHSTIPKAGCNCKGGWAKITKKNKPVFTSAKEFFEWSWLTHDMVNEKLTKPYRPTLEETYAIWCPDKWKISSE